MQREIEYFTKVRSTFDQGKKAIIYHPSEEIDKTSVQSALELLQILETHPQTKGSLRFRGLDEADRQSLLDSVSNAIRGITGVGEAADAIVSLLRDSGIVADPVGGPPGALDADVTTRLLESESGTNEMLLNQISNILRNRNHYIDVARLDRVELGLTFARDEGEFFRATRMLCTPRS